MIELTDERLAELEAQAPDLSPYFYRVAATYEKQGLDRHAAQEETRKWMRRMWKMFVQQAIARVVLKETRP